MNSGLIITFLSGKCIEIVGVSGAIFWLTFLRFWRVDEDNISYKTNLIYRPTTAELSMETIRNPKVTFILPSKHLRFLLHEFGCATINCVRRKTLPWSIWASNSNITIKGMAEVGRNVKSN